MVPPHRTSSATHLEGNGSPLHEELKERSRAVWSTGDYEPTSRQLQPVSDALVEALGVGATAGMRVLDVASGHGNCAVAAARLGATVIATDFSPKMIAAGSARTQREGLDIVWQEADAAALPFGDDSFDRVTSVFGAIFAPEQALVAAEVVRVVRPGGLVGLTSWTPDGLTGQVVSIAREFGPTPPPDAPDPFRWGLPDVVRALFDPLGCEVQTQRRSATFRYPSWADWRGAGEAHGMAVVARRTMAPQAYEEMRRKMQAVTAEHNYGEGQTVVFDSDYLEIIVRKS